MVTSAESCDYGGTNILYNGSGAISYYRSPWQDINIIVVRVCGDYGHGDTAIGNNTS